MESVTAKDIASDRTSNSNDVPSSVAALDPAQDTPLRSDMDDGNINIFATSIDLCSDSIVKESGDPLPESSVLLPSLAVEEPCVSAIAPDVATQVTSGSSSEEVNVQTDHCPHKRKLNESSVVPKDAQKRQEEPSRHGDSKRAKLDGNKSDLGLPVESGTDDDLVAEVTPEQLAELRNGSTTTVDDEQSSHVEDDDDEDEEVEFVQLASIPTLGHEYDLLDDLNEYEEEEDCSSSDDSEDDEGWIDSEVDALLDRKLEEYWEHQKEQEGAGGEGAAGSGSEGDKELFHERKEKIILRVRGQDHFEVLPEGWIEVTHNSGMPVYLHKHSRVCTLSKPYFLGPGSARKHEVPISAIPCLQYRRELEREQQQKDSEKEGEDTLPVMDSELIESSVTTIDQDEVVSSCPVMDKGPIQNGSSSVTTIEAMVQNGSSLPNAKIETVQENTKEKSLDGMKLRTYCSRLFDFQTITVRRFKTWAGRRKHQKKMKQMHRPTLPIGTKLITCPLPSVPDTEDSKFVNPRREFVMNPNGKSYVCILHEYVQHAMRVQPRYTFKELENASTPYGATVLISDMKYGSGFGSSKKHAKLEAAKATLMILIPQMENINPEDKSAGTQQDLAFFDEIRVEDPRISELCAKAGQNSPYQILLECLRRNHGMGDTQIKFEMNTIKHQKNEFKMTVGKHSASVICKNKRDGKQRASQAILQILHPHITTWGSMLRLYGKGSCKTLREKKVEEQLITELQARTTQNKPNKAILNKLKEEMLKLNTKQNLIKPIGKFLSGDLEPPSSSGSNLKNVEL